MSRAPPAPRASPLARPRGCRRAAPAGGAPPPPARVWPAARCSTLQPRGGRARDGVARGRAAALLAAAAAAAAAWGGCSGRRRRRCVGARAVQQLAEHLDSRSPHPLEHVEQAAGRQLLPGDRGLLEGAQPRPRVAVHPCGNGAALRQRLARALLQSSASCSSAGCADAPVEGRPRRAARPAAPPAGARAWRAPPSPAAPRGRRAGARDRRRTARAAAPTQRRALQQLQQLAGGGGCSARRGRPAAAGRAGSRSRALRARAPEEVASRAARRHCPCACSPGRCSRSQSSSSCPPAGRSSPRAEASAHSPPSMVSKA